MVKSTLTHDYLEFNFQLEIENLPFEIWEINIEETSWPAFLILRELVENGKAEVLNNSIKVPHEELCLLSSADQRILGLPDPYPFDIRIDSDNDLGKNSFQYKWYFCSNPQGGPISARRIGSIIEFEDSTQYLLSFEQFKLCAALEKYNELPLDAKTFNNNLLEFSKIKELSGYSGAVLDSYLQNENVLTPQKIKLKVVKENDGSLKVLPEIDSEENTSFEKSFDRYPEAKDIYSVEGKNGNRTRVVFEGTQKKELKKIKKLKKVTGDDKQRLFERPTEIFDPDVIDLDYFSQRVFDIGVYKPKFYPFVSPYKSQWIPGLVLEKTPGERVKIKFINKEELDQFEKQVEEAKQTGKSKIEWKNEDIPLPGIEKVITVARKQFENPKKPVNVNGDEKVLIVHDNVEELAYNEYEETLSAIEHNFSTPPNLCNGIKLLSHQKEGIAWLQSLYRTGLPGALLADDMGLGKTLQILSFISWHNEYCNINKRPYLIVAPVSLLENWQNEYRKFFSPNIPRIVELYGGNLSNIENGNLETNLDYLSQNAIFLTTYETIRSKHQFAICAANWASIFLDEAQKVKTPGTLVTNAVKALKADFKVALTGTPVENSLMDLWCIMDFAVPGLLGSGKEFANEFHKPLKKSDTDVKELGESLRGKIGIHIKRRLKIDILKDLPPKQDIKKCLSMPPVQHQRYEMEIAGSKSMSADKNHILKTISLLRDISDHPYLADRELNNYSMDQLIDSSAKLKLTAQILEDIQKKGEKVLLFADRKETQKLLARLLIEKFGISPSIINGDTPAAVNRISSSKISRQQAIDRFQSKNGFNAIVMSPIATGVGLNITGANNVIHYSRHWNPAKEDQATDRVYRIGQEKEVNVYYPFSVSDKFRSFDITLDEHLSKKRSLASASLFPTEQIEINPIDLFEDLTAEADGNKEKILLAISDLDTLNPYIFEAAIALIWEKLGYEVKLTPRTNDKGADVIAMSPRENILLQVKQSKSPVGDSAIGEIKKAQGYYSNLLNLSFNLGVVTNNSFNLNTKNIAFVSKVELFDRSSLLEYMKKMELSLSEVKSLDNKR